MFVDIDKSKELMEEYDDFKEENQIDLGVEILTYGHWPY